MAYTTEEKVLLFGGLFHDIGKFEQRCTNNPEKSNHIVLGVRLVEDNLKEKLIKILDKDGFEKFTRIIAEHHQLTDDKLTSIVQIADRISAGGRVEKEEFKTDSGEFSSLGYKHLASVFSKVQLLGTEQLSPRYFRYELLTKEAEYENQVPEDRFNIVIPENLTVEKIDANKFTYNQQIFDEFIKKVLSVLALYKEESDFENVLNLLLLVFEKYLWCIPDYTGGNETDISLYNHLKDVAGVALAMYRAEQAGNQGKMALIIGDIPGIQKYIFNVVNKKPAKILRGRSIFIQVFTRILVNKFLQHLNLPETNVIMSAGGKFYILSSASEETQTAFNEVNKEIEQHLYDEFNMELGFNSALYKFNSDDLKNNTTTFGEIVEAATIELNKRKNLVFSSLLFNGDSSIFTRKADFIDPNEENSDSVKCAVTEMPIRKNAYDTIKVPDGDKSTRLDVTRQVKIEYTIGEKVLRDNMVIPVEENGLAILAGNIEWLSKYEETESTASRIILNPDLNSLLKALKENNLSLKNTSYIEVANFCSTAQGQLLDFEDISNSNNGAKFLTLIKGDIDNLGLIMAYGLHRDGAEQKDLTSVSRTTTLSTHLKYFFSFFLNGFMQNCASTGNDRKIYTVFAGGDDLMLVTPQSYGLSFVNELNERFNEFVCNNKEVHISYSVTHFKHHTPIRIVANMAEHNQSAGKKINRDVQLGLVQMGSTNAFYPENDKAGTFMFSTVTKNARLEDFKAKADEITDWVEDEHTKFSHGLVRKLLEVAEAIKQYDETGDPAFLLWHARLSYTVNRLLNNGRGELYNTDVREFFEKVLSFNGNEAKEIKEMLYPLACQVIYNLRNS